VYQKSRRKQFDEESLEKKAKRVEKQKRSIDRFYAEETIEQRSSRVANQTVANRKRFLEESSETKLRRQRAIASAKNSVEGHLRSREAALECQNRFEVALKKSKSGKIGQNRPEVIRKRSEFVSLAIAEGRFNPYSKIRGYFRTKNDERISFSSSYELRRFLQLEEANIKFKRYHGIRISYSLNDKGFRSYTPDLLREDNIIEEVKPFDQANDPVNVAKWSAAREFCKKSSVYKFETIFEDTLFRDISYVDFLKSMLESSLRDRIEITEEVENRIRVNQSRTDNSLIK
jgi:hypothetical protein